MAEQKKEHNVAKASPEGITYTDDDSVFAPFLPDVVAALLADENWDRATAALGEGQCLDDAAWNLFNRSQQDVIYDDAAARYAYLLKYMPFYAVEYELMYQDVADLLADRLWDEGVSVCSIGAGNLVDYWSFVRAFANWGKQHKNDPGATGGVKKFIDKLAYLGIDRASWDYPFAFLKRHANKCKRCYGLDIADEAAAAEVAAFDPLVYFFPKSLNEFDDSAIKAVSQIIARSTHPQVYVAISLPTKEVDGRFTTEAGKWSIDKLRNALQTEGCTLAETPARHHEAGTELTNEQAKDFPFAKIGWKCQIRYPILKKCKDKKHPEIDAMARPDRLNWQIFSCTCPQDARGA